MSRLPYVSSKVEVGRSQQRIMTMFRRFSVDSFSFHEKPCSGEFIIQFQYRGFPVSLPFSSEGVFQAYLRTEPWTHRKRKTKAQYEEEIREQSGRSIYRLAEDLLKAQFAAIEFGLISFEDAFLGSFFDMQSGKRLAEVMIPRLKDYVGGRLALKGRDPS